MGIVFIVLSAQMVVVSLMGGKTASPKAITLEQNVFKTTGLFNAAAMGIIIILAVLYILFW